MSGKNFKKGFSGLLGEEIRGKESTPGLNITRKAENVPQDEKRATFIVLNEQLDALKAISFWERRMLKDVLKEALSAYILNYEKKNGKIKYPQ